MKYPPKIVYINNESFLGMFVTLPGLVLVINSRKRIKSSC